MTRPRVPLLVVGASARAVAQSAAAAGFEVGAIDLFNDVDLLQVAGETRRSVRFPTDILKLVREFPPSSWLYTGGLENYPRLVERISADRPLFGCPASVLRQVRNLAALSRQLDVRPLGVEIPRTITPAEFAAGLAPDDAAPDRPWLLKRRRSSAGLGVVRWTPATADNLPRGAYLQQEIVGTTYGASYLSNGREACFLGLAEQLVQPASDGTAPFRYAGSITAPKPTTLDLARLAMLGDELARRFGIVGLFGIDLVRTPDGRWYLLELNPRPTASMELWEPPADRPSLIEWHVQTCLNGRLPTFPELPPPATYRGKLVVYARELRGRVSPQLSDQLMHDASHHGRNAVGRHSTSRHDRRAGPAAVDGLAIGRVARSFADCATGRRARAVADVCREA
ncbi:MAG: ATP-grasp domain-containing protein [Pirellulales bacterium]